MAQKQQTKFGSEPFLKPKNARSKKPYPSSTSLRAASSIFVEVATLLHRKSKHPFQRVNLPFDCLEGLGLQLALAPKTSWTVPAFTPMYAAISLRRTPIILRHISLCSTTTTPQPHRRNPPVRPHEFANPAPFLGSWEAPSTPREAEAKLDRLRKDYARKMKHVRKEYAYEMEMLRLEKEKKDEAAKEARRVENERRKAEKAKAAESKAVERKAFEQEFRQMLMKERAQKLESWRAKEEAREKKKREQRELIRKQSSVWIAEENLQPKILDSVIGTCLI